MTDRNNGDAGDDGNVALLSDPPFDISGTNGPVLNGGNYLKQSMVGHGIVPWR
jgi:hypothetical protein